MKPIALQQNSPSRLLVRLRADTTEVVEVRRPIRLMKESETQKRNFNCGVYARLTQQITKIFYHILLQVICFLSMKPLYRCS